MSVEASLGLYIGVILLGAVHGMLPDHGWPVASMYALNQHRSYFYGTLAGFILGFGHLVSSIAVVIAYFWTISYFNITEIHWLNYVAGGLLIILGVREYVRGGHSHDHQHTSDAGDVSIVGRIRHRVAHSLPFGHDHGSGDQSLEATADERGLLGIAAFAFALGFAHNEEIEIIAICTGTAYCLELMLAYALAVLVAVMTMTLLLIAGFEHYRDRVEQYQGYLPAVTAAVLILMGFGFILGIF